MAVFSRKKKNLGLDLHVGLQVKEFVTAYSSWPAIELDKVHMPNIAWWDIIPPERQQSLMHCVMIFFQIVASLCCRTLRTNGLLKCSWLARSQR